MKERIHVVGKDENGNKIRYIVNNTSSVTSIIEGDRKTQKCYAAIMRCGHASDPNKFVPIMFAIHAQNKDEALNIALHLPRVKSSDNKGPSHCISIFEISWAEAMILDKINDNDPFLHAQNKREYPKELLKNRELFLPNRIKYTKNGTVFEEDGQFIKFAYQYPEEMVLQRYLAPTKVGGQIITPRKLPPKHILLHQYIGQYLKSASFNSKNFEDFCTYYKMFGHIRPQIFSLWMHGRKLYCSRNGFIESEIIPDKILENWIRHRKEFSAYDDKGKPNDTMSMTAEISADEYNQAMQARRRAVQEKFAKYQRPTTNPKPAQPGDE